MTYHYQYRCRDCGKIYPPGQVETEPVYLCPDCGKLEKNNPLSGVLLVEYDYAGIKNTLQRKVFLKYQPGCFWDYPVLWPLDYDKNGLKNIPAHLLNRLVLQRQPLLDFQLDGRPLIIMDETGNPTYSFKDRASALVILKAMQMGITEIAVASTGNAGSSLAGLCARCGLKAHVFVPSNIPKAKRLQIQSYGAGLYICDGDYDQAFDLCLEVSRERGWYNRNTAYNPLTIEGKKWAAFDIFLASSGNLPDIIIVPVGDGVILSGLYKGFEELLKLGWIDALPRLVAAQASGSDALVRFIEHNRFEYKPANTLADSIHAGAPRNLFMAADAVKSSNGRAIRVSDEAILRAQKSAAREMGLFIEPAAAASLAAYKKLKESGEPADSDKILLLFSGSALKDQQSLERWNPPPLIRSYDQWLEMFRSDVRQR